MWAESLRDAIEARVAERDTLPLILRQIQAHWFEVVYKLLQLCSTFVSKQSSPSYCNISHLNIFLDASVHVFNYRWPHYWGPSPLVFKMFNYMSHTQVFHLLQRFSFRQVVDRYKVQGEGPIPSQFIAYPRTSKSCQCYSGNQFQDRHIHVRKKHTRGLEFLCLNSHTLLFY